MPKSARTPKTATEPNGGADTTSAICQRDLLLKQLNRMDAENGGYDNNDGDDGDTDNGQKHPTARGTLRERLKQTSDALHLKSAMAHVGLLVSLSIYCAVGGLVGSNYM